MTINWEDDEPPTPAPPAEVEITSITGAMAWGDSWVEAHQQLLRDFRRLENAHDRLTWERDYYRSLVGYLDPFLPRWLQDEKQRAANEALYATLADSRRDSIT